MSLQRGAVGVTTSQIANFEYDGDGNPIYAGYAVPGTANSAALWLIFKYTWVANNCTMIRVADAIIAYGSVWDDRASYTYA